MEVGNFTRFRKWRPTESSEYVFFYALEGEKKGALYGFVIRKFSDTIPYEINKVAASVITDSTDERYEDCTAEEFMQVLQEATATLMQFSNTLLMKQMTENQ